MRGSLHLMTDEEREARMALYRADMAQLPEPDHLPGEWPPGSAVGFLIAGVLGALIGGALGFVAYNVGSL